MSPHLSLFFTFSLKKGYCPSQVVQFANDDMEFKNYSNAIVIISAPTEERYQVEDNLRIGIVVTQQIIYFNF